VDGHGKAQPGNHAARVGAHGFVDEFLQLAELDDRGEIAANFDAAQPQQRSVEMDVLETGEIGMKTGAELEQGPNAALAPDRAGGGAGDADDDAQQRAFAGAVGSEYRDALTRLDAERDVPQRPECAAFPLQSFPGPLRQQLALVVQLIGLADVIKMDNGHAGIGAERYSQSIPGSRRNPSGCGGKPTSRQQTSRRKPGSISKACPARTSSGSARLPGKRRGAGRAG
jgi:hypothetical protein